MIRSRDLIIEALDKAGSKGLTVSDLADRISGLTTGTLRAYAHRMFKADLLVKRLEEKPGYPYMPKRSRYWLPKYFPE